MWKKVKHLLLSEISIAFLGLIFTLYLARVQGASFLGSFVLYTSILSISLLLSKLGFFYSLEKKASEVNSNVGKIISSTILLNLCLLTIVLFVILTLKKVLENYIGVNDILSYLLISLVLGNFIHLNYSILKSQKKFEEFAKYRFLNEFIYKVLSIILLTFFSEFLYILIAKIISDSIVLLLSTFKIKQIKIILQMPELKVMKDLINLARYNAVLEIRSMTFSWIDVWMIGLFLEQKYVGLYQTAWQISSSILMVGKAIISVSFPHISEWASVNKWYEIKNNIMKTLPYILLVPIPTFFGSFILGKDVLIFFGQEFSEGVLVLVILTFCSIFRALQELFSKLLVAIGLARYSYYSSIFTGIINIVLNFFLIYSFQLEGAAIATFISVFINFATCFQYFKRKTKLSISFKKVYINMYSSIIMLFILYLFKFLVGIESLFINLLFGIIVWALLMYFLFYRREKVTLS